MKTFLVLTIWVMFRATALFAQLGNLKGEIVTFYPNQDFENEKQDWGFWPPESKTRLELDTQVVQHGKQSLRVTAVDAGDRAFVLAGYAPYEPGVMYRLTVHVRKDASVPDSALSYFVNFVEQRGHPIKSRQYPAVKSVERVGNWERWSGVIVPGKEETLGCLLLGVEHTVGRVWFDNVIIEKLGKPENLQPDVWTNLTAGVEIGSPPLDRFNKHRSDNTPIFQMATRFNDLLWRSALLEGRLRDLHRCSAYTGRTLPASLNRSFGECDALLNETYLAYAAAFRAQAAQIAPNFTDLAGQLAARLDLLEKDLSSESRQLLSRQNAKLPPRLGPQNLGVKALTPSGRMNGLLFGVWSPYDFSQLEQERFHFTFHSGGPGAPKVHTETEMDFSNITEMCDRLQGMGYAGTFGMLSFGLHQYIYAPQWLLDKYRDEKDFFKLSWDGLNGESSRDTHALNYFHPAVRQYIRDYLTRYATFCKGEPRMLYYEVHQEAYPDFTAKGQLRMACYGPHALRAFHDYLRNKYKGITNLNRQWDTNHASFESIEPPPDPYVKRWEKTSPLTCEFANFDEQAYIDYLKLIYDSLKAADPSKPIAARHSGLLSRVNGARIFETCDILSYHQRAPQMNLGNFYLNSLNRYGKRSLGYLEDFWGCQEEAHRVWDETAQRRGLEKHVLREGFWGRVLQMKWYAYTSGSYIFTYNGNWFNPRTDLTTWRYCVPALAIAKQKLEQVDWMLTHSEIVSPKLLILQPSASMRNEKPSNPPYGEIMALHHLLVPAGLLYELVPEEYVTDGRCRLSDFRVVSLPRAKYLSHSLQQKLADFVTAGGSLLALGKPGVFDELARPNGWLCQSLQQATAESDWQKAEQAWSWSPQYVNGKDGFVQIVCGKGRLLAANGLSALTTVQQRQALTDLLTREVPRAAWAENNRVEVLLRVAEDRSRYLCILNPSVVAPAADTIHLTQPAKRAVDVLIHGGCPVPVKTTRTGASLSVCLGPGEGTVVYVE